MYVSTYETMCFDREDSEGLSDKILCVVDMNRIGKEAMNAFFSIVMSTTSSELMKQYLQRFGEIGRRLNPQ